jgi:hypothetical protein
MLPRLLSRHLLLPNLSSPNLSFPKLSLSRLSLPNLSLPNLSLPKLSPRRLGPDHWPFLPPWLRQLPGAGQRRRTLLALTLALLCFLLRPWPPFQALPGWVVGGLGAWAVIELLRWNWRPVRWR